MLAYIYEISSTLNSTVNIEKLDLEIRSSTIENYETPPYILSGKIYINFSSEPSVSDKSELDTIVSNHDGAYANINESSVQSREKKIRELTEMAIYHPSLDNTEVVEYLTSIDNWFNSWKRSGIDTVLISKIVSDATSGSHSQDAFLNTVVNPQGNKTYEFLISAIQS